VSRVERGGERALNAFQLHRGRAGEDEPALTRDLGLPWLFDGSRHDGSDQCEPMRRIV
jgi:hypothetical protein